MKTLITALSIYSVSEYWYWITLNSIYNANHLEVISFKTHLKLYFKAMFMFLLLQAGSLSQFLTFRLWTFSAVKKSHCSVATSPPTIVRPSGSDWSIEPRPPVSQLWPVVKTSQHTAWDLKIQTLKWAPTSPLSSSKSNKWVCLTLDCICVDSTQMDFQFSVRYI